MTFTIGLICGMGIGSIGALGLLMWLARKEHN